MKKRKMLLFQITFRYSWLIVLSFILVFMILFITKSKSDSRYYSTALSQNLDLISEQLDNRIEEVMQLHTNMLHNRELHELIRRHYDGDPYSSADIYDILNRYRSDSYLFNSVYLIDSNMQLIGSTANPLSSMENGQDLFSMAIPFSQSRAFRSFIPTKDGSLFYFASIYLDSSYNYSAYACIEINQSRLFFDFLKSGGSMFDEIYVLDNGTPFVRYDKTNPLLVSTVKADTTDLSENRRMLSFRKLNESYAGWEILALHDRSDLLHSNRMTLLSLLLVFFLTIVAIILVSNFSVSRILSPLRSLTDTMYLLKQGKIPKPLPVEGNDQISVLIQGYNQSVLDLERLNERLMAVQKEKHSYEVAMLKTQLDLLQNQINPHFIHNTLNTLNYLALKENNAELSNTIVCFNALLRASISVTRDFNTVSEEIEHVKQYMFIQQHRYADRKISCICTMDKKSEDALLPRLILQPLVENSLFHGLLPNKSQTGEIHVLCMTHNDTLCIYIIDNGVGIPEERLSQINRGEVKVTNGYSHIGLNNVKERLALLYGSSFHFSLISQEGAGTTIFFSIPYRR